MPLMDANKVLFTSESLLNTNRFNLDRYVFQPSETGICSPPIAAIQERMPAATDDAV